MSYYFIADLHFSHNREFIYKTRGFNSIEEHDVALLSAINSTVKQKDVLYILGDVGWYDSIAFLSKITCNNIQIIKGNHDATLYQNYNLVPKSVSLQPSICTIRINGQKITLSHFPMLCWESSHWNSWLIYGHVHNKKLPIDGKMFDVCPIVGHLQPYSFEEISEIMKSKPDNWDLIKD